MDYHNITRNQLCPCGSQKKFKHCHGNLSSDRSITTDDIKINSSKIMSKNGYYLKSLMTQDYKNICQSLPAGKSTTYKNIPPGLLIIENFIDDVNCEKIIEHTENIKFSKASIEKINNNNSEINESQRKTEIFDLGDFNNMVKAQLVNTFKKTIMEYYKKTINFYEQPHILRYSVGGFYNLHSDAEYWNHHEKSWIRTNRRELSFLIYLNDDFTGGDLDFPNFNFQYKPKKGDFLCFPSDHRFMHQALPTITGTRYAIVTWAMIEDSKFDEKLPPLNPDLLIKALSL